LADQRAEMMAGYWVGRMAVMKADQKAGQKVGKMAAKKVW